MKKTVLLVAAMLLIGTAGFSGCTHAQAGRTSESAPESISEIVSDEQPAPPCEDEDCDGGKCRNGDCRNGNGVEPDFEEAQPDENKIPEPPERKHRKKHNGRRRGHSGKTACFPAPRRMPRKIK